MTEDEWTTSEDPDLLLEAAHAMKRLPARKARLFSAGCFRLVWDRIASDDIKLAIEMSDARADKKISQQELERHRYPMTKASDFVRSWLAVAIQSLATSNLNPGHVAHQGASATENSLCRVLVEECPAVPRPIWYAKLSATLSFFDLRARVGELPTQSRRASDYDDDWPFEPHADPWPMRLMDAGCEEEQIIGHCAE